MTRRNIILFFALILFLHGRAQFPHLTFRHITRSSGLPVDNITALAQDSSGFIWIGSKEGLFRYDGFNFTAFYSQPGNANTLPENIITTICVSRNGLIWVGTIGGGIACMQPNGKVLKIFNSTNNSLFTGLSNHVNDIKEDENGNIWWTSVEGFYKFSKEGKLERFLLSSPLRRGNLFNAFAFGRNGNIWLAGFLGLKIFDTQTNRFIDPNDAFLREKKDVAKISFHGDKLWYTNWLPELGSYDTSLKLSSIVYTKTDELQPDFQSMSNAFYVDTKKNLWIATGKGLYLVKNSDQEVTQSFHSEAGNNYSLVNNVVNCILEDREGNIWIGTDQGISITKPYDQPVINYSLNTINQSPFANKQVNEIIKVESNIYLVGTHFADGLYQTDSNFNVTKHFGYKDVRFDWIWTSCDDRPRNRILISTQHGMLVYDRKTKSVTKSEQLMCNDIQPASAFFRASDSILWMSKFRNAFIRYNLNNNTYKRYELREMGLEPQVCYLSGEKGGSVWVIAHSSGIFRFDENKGKFTDSFTVNNSARSIKQTNVIFFIDLGAYFLIGYQSKGLSLYDKKSKTFRHFTQADGLASNNVEAALNVDDKEVWIATSNGLSLFNINTHDFTNYNYGSGILTNDIQCIASLDRGRIAAGTTNGLVVFTPQLINANRSLPAPAITSLNVYGREISIDSMQNKPIDILHNENYFSFDYISLQYQDNTDIEYSYRLEGFDKDWIYAGKRRFASYSNIKGGNYRLKVKARRPGGEWVESKTGIAFVVHTAFYTRWWFYAICALLVSTIVYAVFRYRVHQLLKIERMRTIISSDLHDEVGASLTSISLFSEMARRSVNPSSKEEEYLVRIGDRSRDSIEKMSDIIWSINPDNDSLQQMLVRMKNYATEITEASDVAVHWKESGNFAASKLSMEQRKNVYLLFKEAMNNCIKHADAENIWVDLVATSNVINMKISDDGDGFDLPVKNNGNGIKNIHRRAAALKGTVFIHSEKSNGTSVVLEFHY